jgi:hypothetical protein
VINQAQVERGDLHAARLETGSIARARASARPKRPA